MGSVPGSITLPSGDQWIQQDIWCRGADALATPGTNVESASTTPDEPWGCVGAAAVRLQDLQ